MVVGLKEKYDLFNLDKTFEVFNLIGLKKDFQEILHKQGITEGALSWHLTILKKNNLVVVERIPKQRKREYKINYFGLSKLFFSWIHKATLEKAYFLDDMYILGHEKIANKPHYKLKNINESDYRKKLEPYLNMDYFESAVNDVLFITKARSFNDFFMTLAAHYGIKYSSKDPLSLALVIVTLGDIELK